MSESLRSTNTGHLGRRDFVHAMAARLASATVAPLAAAADPAGSATQAGSLLGVDAARHETTVIAQVRLRGRSGLWNVALQADRISRISQDPLVGSHVILGAGRLLTEGLVEHHIHLDKTLTADRLQWDEETLAADRRKWDTARASGQFLGFFGLYRESLIKHTFTEDDVFDRAMRMARILSANGTTAIRSHAAVDSVRGLNCVKGLLRARDAMRSHVDLQVVVFPQDDHLVRSPQLQDLMRRGLELGADGIGGYPQLEWDRADEYIDLICRLAKEHHVWVDMHIDEGSAVRANPRMFSHPIVVAKTRKYGLQQQVTASHSFSLDLQPRERTLPVIDELREEGIHLACSPYSSLEGRVQIPRSRGVLVSLINDNVRDPLVRGGRADPVEQAAIYCRGASVGSSDEALDAALDLITTCPGRAMRLRDYGLREGGRADVVLFEAKSVGEALLQQAGRALVIKAGKIVAQSGHCLW